MNRALYFLHRWLGLVVAAQLLAWSAGGLLFSLLDIDDVHGDLDRVRASPSELKVSEGAPIIAVERALALVDHPSRATLVERRGQLVWQIDSESGKRVVDAHSGALLARVDEAEATRLALADVTGARGVLSVALLEHDPPIEYREKPLPAWQVVVDHDKTIHIYVDAVTGEVTARRNAKWRLYDFFWMLHVMDYGEREDFHHPWLTALAVLAVLVSSSGLVLWGTRAARRFKRARAPTSVPP